MNRWLGMIALVASIPLFALACASTVLRGEVTPSDVNPGVGETRTGARVLEKGCLVDAIVDLTACGSGCRHHEFPLRVFDRGSGLILGEAPVRIGEALRVYAEVVVPFSRAVELEDGRPLELYLFSPDDPSKYLDAAPTSLPPGCGRQRVVWKDFTYTEDDDALTLTATLIMHEPKRDLPPNTVMPDEAKAHLFIMGEGGEIIGVSPDAMMVPMVSSGAWNLRLRLPWTRVDNLDPSFVLVLMPVLDMDNLSNEPTAPPFIRSHGNLTIQTWAGGSPERQISHHRAEADRLSREIQLLGARLRTPGER